MIILRNLFIFVMLLMSMNLCTAMSVHNRPNPYEHILERHASFKNQGMPLTTSLFTLGATPLEQREQIIYCCKVARDSGTLSFGPQGRTLKHYTFANPIGIDANGHATNTIRVVLKDNVAKQIITAYPVRYQA